MARKEIKDVSATIESSEDVAVVAVAEPVKKEAVKAPRPRVKKEVVTLEMDPVDSGTEIPNAQPVPKKVTAASVSPSALENDDEIKKAVALKQATEALIESLEKTSTLLQAMPVQLTAAWQQALKSPTVKPSPLAKLSLIIGGFSIVLSVLGLSVASSVRQTLMAHTTHLEARQAMVANQRREEGYQQQQQQPVAAAPRPTTRAEKGLLPGQVDLSDLAQVLKRHRQAPRVR